MGSPRHLPAHVTFPVPPRLFSGSPQPSVPSASVTIGRGAEGLDKVDPALGLRDTATARVFGPAESVVAAAVVVPEFVAGDTVA